MRVIGGFWVRLYVSTAALLPSLRNFAREWSSLYKAACRVRAEIITYDILLRRADHHHEAVGAETLMQ